VDDFLIAGDHRNPLYLELREKLKTMYRWGAWEKGTCTMCSVRTQNLDFSFELYQAKYVHDTVTLIDVPKGTDRKATDREVSQLRGVLGGLQWKVTQTGPQLAATLHALQGQVNEATVKTLKEANDLVKVAKAKDFPIPIHHHNYCNWTNLVSVTWTDAAQADRPDGKSTGGYVSGFANKHHIDSNDWTPITLIGWNTSKLPRGTQQSVC
jgi:hypothetical protein